MPLRHFPISAWYNWETGERYGGGSEQLVAAAIDEIPLFVPGGVPIVTREPTLRMATAPLEKLVIVCYPGEPGSYHEFELYEDDGISDAHERGAYSTTPVRVWWFDNEVKVEVGIRVGVFEGMVQDREVVLELRGVERATWVRVDDEPSGEIVGEEGRVRIDGGTLKSAEVKRFSARFEACEAGRLREALLLQRVQTLFDEPVRDENDIDQLLLLKSAEIGSERRAALRALLGSGIRRDGETLHLYRLGDLTLVERLGAEEVDRRRLDTRAGDVARVQVPPWRSAPRLGLTLRRELVEEHEFWAEAQVDHHLVDQHNLPLRTFRILGPFRYDPTKPMHSQRHGPELVPASERLGMEYIDMLGKPRTWTEAPASDYWPQSIRKICGGHNGEAMAYALTHVWSPEEQEVTLLLESGDRLELWLGDERVFSSDEEGHATESPVEEVRVMLRKGWNQIMGKTNEGGGGWGFRVSIDGRFELRESFELCG